MSSWLGDLDWQLEGLYAVRALVATLLGAAIGWERQHHGRDAGVRTYGAVALGACVFSVISAHVPGADPTRIAANIVTGMGFLGAGVIFRAGDRTLGLTTAATLWATAAIGTAVGFGMYPLAILTAGIVFAVLAAHHLPGWGEGEGPPAKDAHDEQS